MHNLNSLLPQSIIDQIKESDFFAEIMLSATMADSRWPCVRIVFDNNIIFDGQISGAVTITIPTVNVNGKETVDLWISYYNKTDADTIVDATGSIIENQSVTIESIRVNSIDIVKTQIIYNLGRYYLDLSDTKKQKFKQLGLSTAPSHTLYLCENGTWKISLKVPIMKTFVQSKAFQKPSEHWPNDDLLLQIYNRILEVRKMVNKI